MILNVTEKFDGGPGLWISEDTAGFNDPSEWYKVTKEAPLSSHIEFTRLNIPPEIIEMGEDALKSFLGAFINKSVGEFYIYPFEAVRKERTSQPPKVSRPSASRVLNRN